MRHASFWPAMALILFLVIPLWAQQVSPPAEHLGHPVGADFKLPGWQVVSDYYRHLAKNSPHVKLESVGKTTEGRDFLVATISSEDNLARLDEIKSYAEQIADPRGLSQSEKHRALAHARVIVFVTPSMHSTEVAATQMGMEFAWLLATSGGALDNGPPNNGRRDNPHA